MIAEVQWARGDWESSNPGLMLCKQSHVIQELCLYSSLFIPHIPSMRPMKHIQIYYLTSLYFIFVQERLFHLFPILSSPNVSVFNLNVLILSARENFDKRQAIRDSWFEQIDLVTQIATTHKVLPFKIEAHFVIGNQSCLISPFSREDIYDCLLRNSSHANSKEFNSNNPHLLYTLNLVNSTKRRRVDDKKFYKGFSLKPFTSTFIQRIGVLSKLIHHYGQIDVDILNAFSKEKIFNTSISEKSVLEGYFYFTDFQFNFELDSSYTYIVIIRQSIAYEDEVELLWNLTFSEFTSFFKIERVYYGSEDYNSKAFNENEDFPLVNFEFNIKGFDNSRNDHYSKTWHQKMSILDSKLKEESKAFNDIVLVNTIDVYRNLPEKLLLYFQKLLSFNKAVTHVLKTDDDCYLNIFSIVELLLQNYAKNFTWFGNFRKNWPTNYYGKWADQTYTSHTYPQFACGSGYILTRDLVDWLSLNKDYLHRYQGEDVSMGIWMSAIAPNMIQNKRWLCGEEAAIDYRNFLSAPQFTPEAMVRTHSLWNQWLIRQTEKT